MTFYQPRFSRHKMCRYCTVLHVVWTPQGGNIFQTRFSRKLRCSLFSDTDRCSVGQISSRDRVNQGKSWSNDRYFSVFFSQNFASRRKKKTLKTKQKNTKKMPHGEKKTLNFYFRLTAKKGPSEIISPAAKNRRPQLLFSTQKPAGPRVLGGHVLLWCH